MTPKNAKAKIKGDYIALIGDGDPVHFAHVALVTLVASNALLALHHGEPPCPTPYFFSTPAHMSSIRDATKAEIQGYKNNARPQP